MEDECLLRIRELEKTIETYKNEHKTTHMLQVKLEHLKQDLQTLIKVNNQNNETQQKENN